MKKHTLIGITAIIILAGGVYWAFGGETATQPTVVNQMPVTSGENPREGDSIHNLPVEPAAAKARADLAAKLGVSEGSIVILMVEEKTWSDGCLGIGGIADSCLMALVDGFRVEMLAEGKTYIYRTDKTGASVRAETSL